MVELARRTTGAHIYRVLPRGLDVTHDIRNALPARPVDVVFDVGANTGQSAARYLSAFPAARVYCFEPIHDTFRELQHNLEGESRVRCFQLALGAGEGRAAMRVDQRSDMSRILSGSAADQPGTEDVQVSTLDVFCRHHAIDRISFLKVDTEGADLDVLRGAEALLGEQSIDVVEVEAGMNPENTRHVPWKLFQDHLAEKRYYLFGIYEQVTEWPTRRPHLRRANLAFISARASEACRS